MNDNIDLGEEIGYVRLSIAGTEKRIDLYNCCLLLGDLYQKSAGDTRVYLASVADYLKELGYPPVSDYTANRFEKAVFGRIEELKKKEQASVSPDLPASTAQEFSASPALSDSSSTST